MYKIYDFLINFIELFLFSPLFLGFAPMYNTSKNMRGGGNLIDANKYFIGSQELLLHFLDHAKLTNVYAISGYIHGI